VVALLTLLVTLGIPAFGTIMKKTHEMKAVSQGRLLYQGAARMMADMAEPPPEKTLPNDIEWWKDNLRRYGVPDHAWRMPSSTRGPKDKGADWFYAGVTPYDFLFSDEKAMLYLFVSRKEIYGLNVVVTADGSVSLKNFFEEVVKGP